MTAKAAPDETFTVSIPGRGSGLFANSLSATVTRAELEGMILAGFFPDVPADRPSAAGSPARCREWGLPYASDSAITRHLAAFLRDRPAVDAVLFNGGSLLAPQLRERLRDANRPLARRAIAASAGECGARSRRRAGRGLFRQAVAQRRRPHRGGRGARGVCRSAPDGAGRQRSARRPLICILPHGAPAGELIELSDLDLHLRVNTPVRFQVYTSTRHDETKAGDVVELTQEEFHALPPLETVATAPQAAGGELRNSRRIERQDQ